MTTTTAITFTVPGVPQGKGRPRHVQRKRRDPSSGQLVAYQATITPEKTIAYEKTIKDAGERAMAGRPLILGAVVLVMSVHMPIPESWSKKRRAEAAAGKIYPKVKPDLDNVEKAICDGLNEVVWKDDVQVVDVVKHKRYSDTPRVEVEIEPLEFV
ncbi:MAG: RusA family crossover junction endodeoxyribonuclease [Aquabacterium sp.]|uniref:RusA family crossover junction endodeoxyribonuclease n=1 Tax=Aquabacterium sp. TaxID=1872578 RepID=UPI003BAF8F8C